MFVRFKHYQALARELTRLQTEIMELRIRVAVAESTAQTRLDLLNTLREPQLDLRPGGFIPMAPALESVTPALGGPSLFDRMQEVSDGLSLEEIERRHTEFKAKQRAQFEAERARIEAELLSKE